MKKTISISIAGLLFNVEEDAYEKLHTYLESIRAYFAENSDQAEIQKDIEARIAEQFGEKTIITLVDVENIIATMGTVDQFDEEEQKQETAVKKRLYRDPDQAVIGGVASGLAHYVGIDPVIVRGIFLASLFLGGTGLIVYAILWIIVPEATTTAQKLEMRGSHVTLSAMSEIVKEKVEEVKKKSKKGMSIPRKILRGIGLVIQKGIFPALRILFGVIFALTGFIGAVSATTALGIVLFSSPSVLATTPFAPFTTDTLFIFTLISGYIVGLIPLIIIFFTGTSLTQKKNHLKGKLSLSLFLLWTLGLIVVGITGSRLAMNIQQHVETDVSFQEVTQTMEFEEFTKLQVISGNHVTYVEGDTYEVVIKGRQHDVDNVLVENQNGTLIIGDQYPLKRGCFIFCFYDSVYATVTAPSLSDVTLRNASTFEGDLEGTEISLYLANASSMNTTVTSRVLDVRMHNSSKLDIKGTVTDLEISAHNASLYRGTDLVSTDTIVNAYNGSRIILGETETLRVDAHNGSVVSYRGVTEILKKNLHNGSVLRN